MSNFTKQLQRITDRYREAGQPWPATAREIARWAILKNLWQPSHSDLINQCADQLARAMREEYYIDPQGRSVRTKHAAKIRRNGELVGLWDDIRTADREYMAIAFQQRRQQTVGDCRQLKTDVDSYNENRNMGAPVNLVLDFTKDVQELEMCEEREAMREVA